MTTNGLHLPAVGSASRRSAGSASTRFGLSIMKKHNGVKYWASDDYVKVATDSTGRISRVAGASDWKG